MIHTPVFEVQTHILQKYDGTQMAMQIPPMILKINKTTLCVFDILSGCYFKCAHDLGSSWYSNFRVFANTGFCQTCYGKWWFWWFCQFINWLWVLVHRHFIWNFESTNFWANTTSAYDIGWSFCGFVGTDQFNEGYKTETLSTISNCARLREIPIMRTYVLYLQFPSDFVLEWSIGIWLACVHWLNTDRGYRRCTIMFGAYSVMSMWHVISLQHLAGASSEQSVLPIDHVI